MEFKKRTRSQLADMICGNLIDGESFFRYRSSSYITEFFEDIGTTYKHDGTTRGAWVSDRLQDILSEAHPNAQTVPRLFAILISTLMDAGDGINDDVMRPKALAQLNGALAREGFEAFYGDDRKCHLRHIASGTIESAGPNPHRPFTAAESIKRDKLIAYLDNASEDELIEEILLPLFRQLGFHRITAAGHKDMALEYDKDIWIKYALPTQHVIYFGIQAKRDKINSAGVSDANVAKIYNQVTMMLGHEIFDPEIGKRVLVDHAFIVAGGEITKAARNWLGNKLDATKRSQILFMDRDDILNLFVVTNLPLPSAALPDTIEDPADEFPF